MRQTFFGFAACPRSNLASSWGVNGTILSLEFETKAELRYPMKGVREVDRGRNRVSTCNFADAVAAAVLSQYRELNLESSHESSLASTPCQTVLAAFLITLPGESHLHGTYDGRGM